MSSSRPFSKWRLLLECVQRELTYLPLAGSFLLAWLLPDWGPTWFVAPTLFTAGGAHFFYDFLIGPEVRCQLTERELKREEKLRMLEDIKIMKGLGERDQESLVAVRALEKTLLEKVKENRSALELSGTFAHTYEAMVVSLADTAVSALKKKLMLATTARELRGHKAVKEARDLEEKLPLLDERVAQVRATLKEALTQVALMDDEHNQIEFASLKSTLEDRLRLAGDILTDLGDLGRSGQAQKSDGSSPAEDSSQESTKTPAATRTDEESGGILIIDGESVDDGSGKTSKDRVR